MAALVLARNPDLRWHEVKDVLRRSCDRIDLQDGQWSAEGHSPRYGHGRLNAETAARLAVPQPADRLVISRSFSEPVSDFQTATVTLDVGEARTIAGLQVSVDVRHTAVGDLVVSVVPPPAAGAQPVTLHDRGGGLGDDLRRTYGAVEVPALDDLLGKSAQGLWTLEVRDQARRDVGSIMAFGLEIELA